MSTMILCWYGNTWVECYVFECVAFLRLRRICLFMFRLPKSIWRKSTANQVACAIKTSMERRQRKENPLSELSMKHYLTFFFIILQVDFFFCVIKLRVEYIHTLNSFPLFASIFSPSHSPESLDSSTGNIRRIIYVLFIGIWFFRSTIIICGKLAKGTKNYSL